MRWIAVLLFALAGWPSAQAETMEEAFAENCPRSVSADEKTARLHCACVHRQIMETTVFPEDREASFALIGPADTLADMMKHGEALEKLPPDVKRAIEEREQTVLMVIVPLCLISAATGKVLPDGTIRE